MSSPTTAFGKALRSLQTGGLTYTDFIDDLKEMLAAGASVAELREVLERRQVIEPISEPAYAQVSGVLNEAARAAPADATATATADSASPSVDGVASAQEESVMVKAVRNAAVTPLPGARPRPTSRVPSTGAAGPQLFSVASAEAPDSGAGARAAELAAARAALETAQNRIREITDLARSRLSEAHQETERLRSELAKLRQSLAEREAEHAKLQIDQSTLQHELSTLRHEHSTITPGLEARAGTLALELVAAKNALEAERGKGADVQRLRAALAARDAEVAARDAEIAARDATLAAWEKERAIARAAQDRSLAAVQEEHAKALRALESRASSRVHLESDLKTALEQIASLTADLAAVQRALEDQQQQAGEGSAEFAQRTAAAEAARTEAEAALRAAEQQLRTADQQLRAAEHHQSDAKQAREALAERERELVALRQEQTKTARLLEARAERATQLQADLTAARVRADAIEAELKVSQEAAARVVASLKRREAELDTARSEFGALQAQSNSYLESLRSRDWRQGYEHSQDADPAAGSAPTVLRAEPLPPTEAVALQRAAPMAASAATVKLAQIEPAAPLPGAPVRKSGGMQRGALVAAALVALVLLGWLIARHRPAPATARSTPAAVAPGSVIQDCATCPTFTVLPGGRFKQGSPPTDPGYSNYEGPQHWVMLARPLAVSTNPITVDQFAQFITATGRDMQGCDTYDGAWKNRPDGSWKNPGFAQDGSHPVTCVSFNDATAYAAWLSAQTGHTYRLPSASEWEYAARAGGTAAQPWDSPAEACANANVADASVARRYPGLKAFGCDDGFVNTSPVGSFKANAFGLNDMLGNVFQWTQDCWNADYAGAPVDGSARSSGDCSVRELRGGSWFSTPKFVRAAYRNQFAADYRTSSVGIRLVREL